jgi:hypothetical protein
MIFGPNRTADFYSIHLPPMPPLQVKINLKECTLISSGAKTNSFDRRDKLFSFPFQIFVGDCQNIGADQDRGRSFPSDFLGFDLDLISSTRNPPG